MIKQNLRYLIVSLCLLLCAQSYGINVRDFTYKHLTQADGLCSQRIYSICQTGDGAIWWGAKNCVERYNGVSAKCYKLSVPEEYSYYAGRYIKLFVSSSGTLYAFDNKGNIFSYDTYSDSFIFTVDIRTAIGDGGVLNDILVANDQIWFATGNGIYRMTDGVMECMQSEVAANSVIKTEKRLFFCTDKGLLEYKETSGKISEVPMLPSFNLLSGYYDEANSVLWLGSFAEGVKVVSFAKNGKISHITDADSPKFKVKHPVRDFCTYGEEILIGVDGMGVLKADRNSDESGLYALEQLFDANNGETGVLHGNGIYSLLCDTWGNIVIGSYSGGIDIAHPVGMASNLFRHQHNNYQSILNDHVNCVMQMPDGRIAMGTDNGVSIYDVSTQKWVHSSIGSVVIDLCVLSSGKMVAATYGGGLIEVLPDGRSRTFYSVANSPLKDNYVYSVYEDNVGGLWVGCLNGPLVQMKNGKAKHYNINNVKDILQFADGRIAIGTVNGIYLIDPADGQVSELDYFSFLQNDVNKYIQDLYLHNEHSLWIGTDGGGIYIYDIKEGACRQLTVANGLPSNTISSISSDAFGRVLIATDYGLAYVDDESPETAVNVNYGYDIDREYVARAVARLNDNQIIYGTTTGALVINPENLKELDYVAELNLLNVSVGDDSFRGNIARMLNEGELQLKYKHRTFELQFECINLSNQDDIVYQYKVGNSEWSAPSSMRNIRFTNLEPGKHRLMLRCASKSCGVELDQVGVVIVIARPWWSSWWMWIFYSLLIIAAFYGFWYFYNLQTQYMRLAVNNPNLVSVALPGKRLVENIRARNESQPDDAKDFVDKATNLILGHISDSDFNIDQLCREMAMSRTVFYLKLKTYTGKSPQDFIKVIRLEKASTLLRSGKSVSEVAELIGFDNPKYFSTVFKKYFGVSPSKYR